MSHRTEHLPPLTGVAHLIRELRYHEGTRQGFAIVLVVFYSPTAAPDSGARGDRAGHRVRRRARAPLRERLHREERGARDRRGLPFRAPSALHRQHPARRRLRARRLALVGAACRLFFFWFYYPTAIEYEDRKLQRIVRRGLGAMVGAHARADAALYAAPSRPAAGAGRSRVSTAQRRDLARLSASGAWAWVAWQTWF